MLLQYSLSIQESPRSKEKIIYKPIEQWLEILTIKIITSVYWNALMVIIKDKIIAARAAIWRTLIKTIAICVIEAARIENSKTLSSDFFVWSKTSTVFINRTKRILYFAAAFIVFTIISKIWNKIIWILYNLVSTVRQFIMHSVI